MFDLNNLPNDIDSLKKYIQTLASKVTVLENTNTNSKERISFLENIIIDLKRNRFGRKSEQFNPYDELQSRLFNEAEVGLNDQPSLHDAHSEEKIIVQSHERKKTGRKPLPAELQRIDVIHDIEEHEKKCECGACLTKFDEEVSEKLCIVPMQVYVERHIRYKYECNSCKGDERTEAGKIILTAENKDELFKKSILTPELFAYIQTAKFVDHIPFYRLSNILLRYGIEITRATFCNWSIAIYEKYFHLFDFMKDMFFNFNFLQIDETTYQVHKEIGRANTSTSYMFVIRGGAPEKPIIQFIYRETRGAEFLVEYLKNFQGIIQTDGYSSYDSHFRKSHNVIQAGCMAHARRGFEKIYKSTKNNFAGEILMLIRKLYIIEKEIREKNFYKQKLFDEIKSIRQEKSKPIMEIIYSKCIEYKNSVPSDVTVGKAINYTLGQWEKLNVFLNYGEVQIDNNLIENEIRPFVLGRKNWLFSDSPQGANASSFWYSIIQTAKANNREPFKFLLHITKHLPTTKSSSEMKEIFMKALDGDY